MITEQSLDGVERGVICKVHKRLQPLRIGSGEVAAFRKALVVESEFGGRVGGCSEGCNSRRVFAGERRGRRANGYLHALTPNFVIPAKAGIHGLSCKFATTTEVMRMVSAMDSRLRGNDKRGG